MKKLRNHLKNAIIGSLLLLCAIVSLALMHINVYATMTPVATATTSPTFLADPSPTLVPTPTTPPPTPTPTTPPPTPTPVPTPKPTVPPQPTQAPQPRPTSAPIPQPAPTTANTGSTGGIPGPISSTPTATPTTRPKPMATPTMTMATSTAVAGGSIPTDNQDNQQNTDNTTQMTTPITGGSSMGTIIPVAAGSFLLVLLGGLFGLAQLRKRNTQPSILNNKLPLPVAFATTGTSTTSPWAQSQPDRVPTGDQKMLLSPSAASATAMPSLATMQNETLADATAIPNTILPQSMTRTNNEETARSYTPSIFHPITMSLPDSNVSVRPQTNPISIGDMSPLPLDSFDFSQLTSDKRKNDHQEMGSTPRHNANNGGAVLTLQAPNIQDDPVLETIMRQAQMGLYALPRKERKERTSTGSLSGIEKNDFLL